MRLILGLSALVLILAAVALGLPAHVTVARSVVINAPEYAVYPYLINLRRFQEWSPWVARDPEMKFTYSGPREGKGAKVEWVSGKPSIGTGSMQIVQTEPSRSVDLTANINGLEGDSSYELEPSGSGSKVTWSFGYQTGSSPFKRWKALMLDGFIGAEYRAGLEKLKALVEGDRAPAVRRVVPPTPTAPPAAPPAAGGETVVPQQTPAATPAAEAAPPPPPPQ
jgi:hypothetical protein